MTSRQRRERLSIARRDGIEAEKMIQYYFQKRGLNVRNIASEDINSAGDLIVSDETGKKWLIEVKKINEWEQVDLNHRRKGRIQVNKFEHNRMIANSRLMGAKPLYVVVVKHDDGRTSIKYLSSKKVSEYIENKNYSDVKIPYSLLASEDFSFEKFCSGRKGKK